MPTTVDPTASATWTWPDVMGTLNVQLRWWSRLAEGRPAAVDASLPAATAAADDLAAALTALGHGPGDDGDLDDEGLGAVARIEARADRLVAALGGRRAASAPSPAAEAVVTRLTDRLAAAMHTAGRAVTEAAPPPPDVGAVRRLALGGGGVPKPEVATATVDLGGVRGDAHRDRENHGRPWQALCLWSAEVIDALNAEGHPVAPGSCGENVLLAGVDWAEVRPGVRVHLGADVVAEVSGEASPCRTIAGSFTGGRFDRIDHGKHPGWARAYAWVTAPGEVRRGDAVRLS